MFYVILGLTSLVALVSVCVDLQQRCSSSSELSPQSLSPSHFHWGWTHTWFLHSNRNGGQYVPLGKRVAESQSHSVNVTCTPENQHAPQVKWNQHYLRIINSTCMYSRMWHFLWDKEHTKKTMRCATLTTWCLIRVVQTVCVAVTLKPLGDTVSATTLEEAWMTGPQLCNTARPAHI